MSLRLFHNARISKISKGDSLEPFTHDLRNTNFVKSQPVETFKSACMIAKLHNNVEIAFVGIQRGGDKVTTNHLIHMLDLLIDYILDDLGIKLEELSIFTDGSTSENRNRTMLLYLLSKRRALFLRMLAMETGCPHHWNDIPDRYHSHIYLWVVKWARALGIHLKSVADLVNLGNNHISADVCKNSKLTKHLKFIDLSVLNFDEQEDLHENDERDEVAQEGKKMEWIDYENRFPSFMPETIARKPSETVYYLNKFYKCHMHESRPTEFCFKILPGQNEFYVNQVID